MIRKLPLALLLAGLATLAVGPVAQASAAADNIIYVAANASDDGTGNPANCPSNSAGSVSGSDCTLRDAVALSTQDGAGDTIELPAGVTALESQINITVPVTIVGKNGGDSEIEQFGSNARVLSFQPQDAGTYELSGTEIIGGNLDGDNAGQCVGAGIWVNGDGGPTNPVIFNDDLIVNNNLEADNGTAGVAAQGGGLYLTGPDAFLIEDTTVTSNSVFAGTDANGKGEPAEGGGVYYDATGSGGSLTVDRASAISDNEVAGDDLSTGVAADGPDADGGGIFVTGSGTTLIGTASSDPTPAQLADDGAVISDNAVIGGGAASVGGIASGGGIDAAAPVTLRGVSVSDNSVTGGSESGGDSGAGAYGGGVNLAGGASTIVFSTISANNAVSHLSGNVGTVGGISVASGTTTGQLTVYESTIADNGMGDDGKEIPAIGGISTSGPTLIQASTIAGNAGSQAANVFAGADTLTAADALIAQADSGPDCATSGSGSIVDGSGNFVDDFSCGFSLSNGSLAAPGDAHLGSLAENDGDGGPETLLPGPSSLALGQGNECGSEDERGLGLETSSVCDSGAVQVQLPSNRLAPAITPTSATAGQTLTCSSGTWAAGDTQISGYTYKWLEGTTVVATGNTYATSAADAGQAITCQVTATSNYPAGAPATSAPLTPAAPAASGGSGSSGAGSSGSGSSGAGSSGSGSSGAGSGAAGSGGAGSSGSAGAGTPKTHPVFAAEQTGTTVALTAELPSGLKAKQLTIAWEKGAGFGTKVTLKQLAKALSIRSPAGRALGFKIIDSTGARIKIVLSTPATGLVLRVNAKAVKLTTGLARSLRRSHTVTATVTITTTTGTTDREVLKVAVTV